VVQSLAALYGPGTLGRGFYEQNYQGAFNEQLGLGYGQAPRARYLRGLVPEFYQSYLGTVPSRGADYSFLDYLQEQQPAVEAAWRGLSPQERGENPGLFQGRVRFL
jgi:hypothetical protein